MPVDPKYLSKEYIGPTQVAALLGVHVGTLKSWRARNRGPRFHQVTRDDVLYSITDVQEWAAQRRRPAKRRTHNAPASKAEARGESE